tara:strand:+ start:7311 stop:9065 length:1755 start_codon:yes stop_codon:yes gene_type:complete
MATKLLPVQIKAPGRLGLNTQSSSIGLGPEWAFFLDNAVFDDLGRMAARKGLLKVTGTPITGNPTLDQSFEYTEDASNDHIITVDNTNGKLYTGTTTITEKTGSLSFSNTNWQFANLNGKVIGVSQSQFPIFWDGGSGNFLTIHSQHSNWAAGTAYALGATVKAVSSATQERYFVCTSAGTSGGSEPTFPSTEGTTVVDNGATWTTVKMPKGNCIVSAFGRLWAVDSDKTTIRYSAFNNEKLWDTQNGGGTIDLLNNFAFDQDFIKAIAVFNNQLIVFGKNNITIFNSASAPSSLVLADTISGMGCIARDSIQNIGSDIIFLSGDGLRALSRTIELEKMPAQDLSQSIRTEFLDFINSKDKDKIRSLFSQEQGFYLLLVGSTVYMFDFKDMIASPKTIDVPLPKVSRWLEMQPESLVAANDGTIYLARSGYVGKYSGYKDSVLSGSSVVQSSYNFKYRSNWLDFGFLDPQVAGLVKLPKKIKMTVDEGSAYDINFFWAFDYVNTEYRQKATAVSGDTIARGAQWGSSEWNLAEWSGDAITVDKVPAQLSGSGQNIQYGFDVTINGSNIAVSQVELLIKIGRVAR